MAGIRRLGRGAWETTLSLENRKFLLGNAAEALKANEAEAQLILQNLEGLNEELAKEFVIRRPELILENPFRVIRLGDAQDLVDTGDESLDVPSYIAISYCWRHPNWVLDLPPSVPWPFSKPFVDKIIELRKPGPTEGIWIDQLCINQADEVEKRHAVASMDIVYRSCRQVLILLEDVKLEEEEAKITKCLEAELASTGKAVGPSTKEEREVLLSAYKKITSARWWHRAW